MQEQAAIGRDEASILVYLKKIALEQLNMTQEQIDSIRTDAPLMDAMPLDSLNQVILISSIERDLGLTFEPEQWMALKTVDDMLKMIATAAAAQASQPEPQA